MSVSLIVFLQYDHSLSALPFLSLANIAILCLAVMKLVFSPAVLFIFIVQYSEEYFFKHGELPPLDSNHHHSRVISVNTLCQLLDVHLFLAGPSACVKTLYFFFGCITF